MPVFYPTDDGLDSLNLSRQQKQNSFSKTFGITRIKEPIQPNRNPRSSNTVSIYLNLIASITTSRRQLNAAIADAGPAGPEVMAF